MSCDATVATATDDRAFQGQSVGTTRIVAALDGSQDVELRDLRVLPNPTDTVAVLTAPISFGRVSSQLTSAARATLEAKVARLRANPTVRLDVAIREVDAFATRVPITRERTDAITGFFTAAGIASDRIVVRSERLDYQSRDRFCGPPVASYATFTPAEPRLIVNTPPDTSPTRSTPATTVPNRVATTTPPRRPPTTRRTPVAPAVTPNDAAETPQVQQGPEQVANQPAQAPPPLNQPVGGVADSVQLNAPVVGYGATGARAVRGDSGEAPAAMRARMALRSERRLRVAPPTRALLLSNMRAGTYAFAPPRELIRAQGSDYKLPLSLSEERTNNFEFEIHDVSGVKYVSGFVEPQVASSLQRTFFSSPPAFTLLSSATSSATCPIEIPLTSVTAPAFVTSPAPALEITIRPRTKDEPYVPRSVPGCRTAARAS